MPFNVQDFRATMLGDGARSSLFDVQMTFPLLAVTGGTAPGILGGANREVTYRARSSSLPGDAISSIGLNYFGREIKIAGNRSFPEWSFVVVQDEGFNLRNAFERWMSGINSHVNNLREPAFASTSSYQVDAFVTQYSKIGAPDKIYKLVGCFPTDVAAVDLDWSNDGVIEYSVTFAYQWWEDYQGISTDSSTSTGLLQTF